MNHFAFLDHLPKHGALPIPWSTPVGKDGRPNFRATDPQKHNLSCKYQLCGVCGNHIKRPPYAIMVGPLCIQERMVFGTPMHPDCAIAAVAICPHLAFKDWKRKGPPAGCTEIVPEQTLPPKPDRVGIALLGQYAIAEGPEKLYYVALPPEPVVQWFAYVDGRLQVEGTQPEDQDEEPDEVPS